MKSKFFFLLCVMLAVVPVQANNIVWFDGQHPVTYAMPGKVEPVVAMAMEMFCDDMRQVTGLTPKASSSGTIKIVPSSKGDVLLAIWDGNK